MATTIGHPNPIGPRIRALRSGILGTRQVGGIYPSDHAGIWATLRLRKR
ncbi:MAG: hypothetical protein KY433_09530 [Actinobacteria bacterium]|nr:hypothetical protein [Actinomycetota bacterium]